MPTLKRFDFQYTQTIHDEFQLWLSKCPVQYYEFKDDNSDDDSVDYCFLLPEANSETVV